jgi:putative ABC transport system permease protein
VKKEPSVISVAGTTNSFNRGLIEYGFNVNDEHKSVYVFAADRIPGNTGASVAARQEF